MQAYIMMLLFIHAPEYGIDPYLAGAVVKTESTFNPNAIGSIGEVGLFQIRPEHSKYSVSELKNPLINVIEGLKMLRRAKLKCIHKANKQFVICMNTGLAGARKIKHPNDFTYYKKVMNEYSRRISKL